MIARHWHGAVAAERADAYHAYLLRTGVPDYLATPGNLGVYVLRRIEGGEAHFDLLTMWESEEAIRSFAGDDPGVARYYPEDAGYLLRMEPGVLHYEVLAAEPAPAGARLEIGRILDQQRRAYGGDAWCGSALGEALEGVTARQAAARPLARAHTIWELVLHLTAWKGAVRRRLEGEVVHTPEEGDFPPVPDTSEDAWRAALDELQRRHLEYVEAATRLSDAQLERPTNHGSDVTAYVSLHGMLQHDLYHAAKIALLKRAV